MIRLLFSEKQDRRSGKIIGLWSGTVCFYSKSRFEEMRIERSAPVLSREETTELKGCAILIMVLLHLFNTPERVALCHTVFYLGDEPLVSALSRCAGICVPLYVFLSGYGLYLTRRSRPQMRNGRRVALLYLRFWVVLALFLPLGCLLYPEVYPGSVLDFVYNLTGLNTTYNGEWWFLLPYVLLALSSNWLLSLRDRWGSLPMLFLSGILYFMTYLLEKYRGGYLDEWHVVSLMVNYFNLLFSFFLGACSAHGGLVGRLRDFFGYGGKKSMVYALLLFLGLFYIRTLFHTAVFNPLYAVAFVFLFMLLPRPSWLTRLLRILGVQSVNMWLVHSFFCYHLFSAFTYGLHYPLLIFLFVVVVSYITGRFIDGLYKPLLRLFFPER